MLDLSCIFTPVDLSRPSRAAVALARQLAQRADARLELVHAHSPPLRHLRPILYPYAGLGDEEARIHDELRRAATQALVEHLRLDPKRDTLELLLVDEEEGPPEAALAARMLASEAELIVMGACGESGASPGVLGSATLRVLQSAARPVLLVRDGSQGKPARVSVALDLSPSSQAVLQAAVAVALSWELPLEVVVVVPTPESFDVQEILSGALKLDKRVLRRQARKVVDKRLDELQEGLQIPFPWKARYEATERVHTVLWGDPVEELARHCAELGEHLLVLGVTGARQAQLARKLGRTAAAVAANVSSDLLFVP